jgi:hypothetical protein
MTEIALRTHPVAVGGKLANGVVQMIDTPDGEWMRFIASRAPA